MAEHINSLTKYDFPTQNVLFIAVGSGIAPVAAAIESQQIVGAENASRTARLYYGVQNEDELVYTSKYAEWEEQYGVQVIPVLSQAPEWDGRTGYVQTAIEEDGVDIPRNTAAVVCGMKPMTTAIEDLLYKDVGILEGRILYNF